MKDRIVQYPNRYKLTPVSGDIYDITPEPGIVTEPGTDLNKANLLKDDTAALYGLGANAVPDDVFAELACSYNKIGDIKTTVRTDLGDDWLLCNGDYILRKDYPELFDLLPLKLEGTWVRNQIANEDSNIYDVEYGDGYYVAVGSNGLLMYKKDFPYGEWVENYQGTETFYCVKYFDGVWLAGGDTNNTLFYKVGTPEGPWGTVNIPSFSYIRGIEWANGYLVLACDDGQIFYKEGSSPIGEWTRSLITIGYPSKHLRGVKYGNGIWIANTEYGYIYIKTGTPAGKWTEKYLGSDSYRNTCINHCDNYWFSTGYYNDNGYIAVTTDDNVFGNWNKYTVTGTKILYGATRIDGKFVVCCKDTSDMGKLLIKDSLPLDSWQEIPLSSVPYSIIRVDNFIVLGGYTGAIFFKTKTVPEISIQDAYAYIKAK